MDLYNTCINPPNELRFLVCRLTKKQNSIRVCRPFPNVSLKMLRNERFLYPTAFVKLPLPLSLQSISGFFKAKLAGLHQYTLCLAIIRRLNKHCHKKQTGKERALGRVEAVCAKGKKQAASQIITSGRKGVKKSSDRKMTYFRESVHVDVDSVFDRLDIRHSVALMVSLSLTHATGLRS
jgi:hypothetical protein